VVKSVKDNTFNSNRTGAQTVINSDQIKSLPSLSRNIADFARLTPQHISGDDVLSIGGQNNRYNAIYIDGAVNNDVLDYLQTVLMVVKQELAQYLLMLLSNFK
jgi:hypothetical protein